MKIKAWQVWWIITIIGILLIVILQLLGYSVD